MALRIARHITSRLSHESRGRAIRWAVLLLLCVTIAHFSAVQAQGSTTLSWTPPTQHTDGTPLTDLTTYRAYFGTSPSNLPMMQTIMAPASSAVVPLPSVGTWYLVVTALDSRNVESALSNLASKVVPAAPVFSPNVPTNFSLSFAPTPPPPAISVMLTLSNASAGEYTTVLTGAGNITLNLPAGYQWDWCKPGGEFGTVATPTTPDLGIPNNDGKQSPTVTLASPVTTICDVDPNTAPGSFSATSGGVTKPLAKSGSTWQAVFP